MSEIELQEPSFADVVTALANAPDLTERTRQHWVCSLRQIAKALDRPLEAVPARWTAARFPIGRLHHARMGWTPKTLANHTSNVRAALRRFSGQTDVPARGARLSPEWSVLRERLMDLRYRANLSGLMRYCSARGIAPAEVDEAAVDGYMRYRAETTALTTNNTARRAITRAWNTCIGAVQGWPATRLIEPTVRALEGPTWEDFPVGLRIDIESYLSYLTKARHTAKGRRARPCKTGTIKTRRAELIAFVRMAVRVGVPLESLSSAGALLHPDVAVPVIDAYWKKDGAEPRVYTIDLCSKILAVARERGCLDDVALERLEELRADLEEFRQDGLTPKNLAPVRQVLSENVWGEVVNLPAALMKGARTLKDQAPVKAGLLAQIAAAVAILTVAPVRLGNLIRTRLEENLTKPGGIDEPYWLVFPHYDVKNRETLQFPLDQALTDLIDEYIHDFRPALLRGSNEAWLFPGESGGFKTPNMFSTQITERIQKAIGLRMSVHQFWHAAAAIFLKHRPGEHEVVRRLLGHRSIQTTIRFYCGLETIQASRLYGEIVRTHISFEPEFASVRGS